MSVQIPTGQFIETNSPDGTNLRQVVNIGDPATTAAEAKVENTDPASTDYGLVIRDVRGNATLPTRVDPTGTTVQPISGTVSAKLQDGSGTAITSTSGALDINIKSGTISGGNAAASATAAAVPADADYLGAKDNLGNLQGLLVESSTAQNLRVALYNGSAEASVTASNALKVDGSAVTQPISAASLPLPSGAATAAKQPALGTAGTASTDVITVQGIASMTALKVDGSAVTQPVSGTITANIGTSGSLALDASVTGLQVAQGSTTSGQKGDLVQGAVTTNAPTYTTAQTSPVSLDTSGLLRVSIKDTPQNTNAFKVDGSAVTQPVSGTLTVQQSTAANLKVDLSGTAANTTALKVDGSAVTQPVSGTVTVGNATLAVTESGTWTVQPGNTANTTPWLISSQAATSGGATPGKLISAASTNSTNVKSSAGTLYMLTASNTGSAPRYLKIYDKATAPTVGTDTPKFTFLLPTASTAANGAGSNVPIPDPGIAFSSGIGLAITTGVADSDTGAVGANEVVVNYAFK